MNQLTKSEVAPDLKKGDIIEFTNSSNYKVTMLVTRVEEKSWYACMGSSLTFYSGRNSYGTLKRYMGYSDFKIISNN